MVLAPGRRARARSRSGETGGCPIRDATVRRASRPRQRIDGRSATQCGFRTGNGDGLRRASRSARVIALTGAIAPAAKRDRPADVAYRNVRDACRSFARREPAGLSTANGELSTSVHRLSTDRSSEERIGNTSSGGQEPLERLHVVSRRYTAPRPPRRSRDAGHAFQGADGFDRVRPRIRGLDRDSIGARRTRRDGRARQQATRAVAGTPRTAFYTTCSARNASSPLHLVATTEPVVDQAPRCPDPGVRGGAPTGETR